MPSRRTSQAADAIARGAASGARKATVGYYRRRDRNRLIAIGGGLVLVFLVGTRGGDNEPSSTVPEDTVAAPAGDTISTPLSHGSVGPDVVVLQERLAQLGYDVPVDGNFGVDTDAAVRAFQSDQGLTVDGVVGPETGSELGIWSG
jgi:peptidoglycan hydrolase-like protein with peptidoglycan-binding domain